MEDDRRKQARRSVGADAIRTQCYAEIRDCMKARLLAYYQHHPTLLGDQRSQDAIRESTAGLACIFDILDKYRIESAPPERTEP